jgi:hypothetical protein
VTFGLQDREGGLAAPDILVGRGAAPDAAGADDRDAVEDHETAGRGYEPPAMRDDEALQRGLARLSREIRRREVKRGLCLPLIRPRKSLSICNA